jgi:hypothetical protein
MRTIAGAAIAATSLICLIGTATAAELTAAESRDLVTGKTLYLEFNAQSSGGAGKGVIYYATDGTALYKTAPGPIWHGTWTIKGNTVCTDWKEFPNNPCSKWDKQGDTLTQINVVTGKPRGKLEKAVPGNPEKLAP